MKILLVGLGDWGSKHFRILQSLPVELFCSDLRAELLPDGPRSSVNYRDFASQVDAVIIATPAPAHFPLALEFLMSGKDVFVEKPLALLPEQCRELAELSDLRGRILQTGHIFRFDTASRWLRDAWQAGKFGVVRMLRGRFCGFKRPRRDGGGMISDGIHFVDLFNYLVGAPPKTVQAIQHDFLLRGMDDATILSLEYQTESGPVWATVETDYFTPGKHRELVVVGSCSSAVCDYTATQNKITIYENRHTQAGSVPGLATPIVTSDEEPLRTELQAFLNSVVTREKPLADGRAGYDAARVMTAAAESAKTGAPVALK